MFTKKKCIWVHITLRSYALQRPIYTGAYYSVEVKRKYAKN
jgi:hypothetical protein